MPRCAPSCSAATARPSAPAPTSTGCARMADYTLGAEPRRRGGAGRHAARRSTSCPMPVIARVQGDCLCRRHRAWSRSATCWWRSTRAHVLPERSAARPDAGDHQPLRDPRAWASRRRTATSSRPSASPPPRRMRIGFVHEVVRGRRARRQGRRDRRARWSPTARRRCGLQAAGAGRGRPGDRRRAARATRRGASPTSAPATKAARACRPSCSKRKPAWLPEPLSRRHDAARHRPQLLALAAALGWASGLRLYAVVFLTGAGRLPRLGRRCRRACSCCSTRWCWAPAASWCSSSSSPTRSRPRFAVGHGAHGDPHPGRRGAGGRRVRRRPGGDGRWSRRCSAARWPPPRTPPRRRRARRSTPRPSRSPTSALSLVEDGAGAGRCCGWRATHPLVFVVAAGRRAGR